MFNPFQRPEEKEERNRSLWQRLSQPSEREVREADEVVAVAEQFLEWFERPYTERFLQWLRDEADRPMDLASQSALLAGAARGNAFKEVRQHLLREQRNAEIALRRR